MSFQLPELVSENLSQKQANPSFPVLKKKISPNISFHVLDGFSEESN